ncbi:MAG: hypothetical protein RIR69_1749 [Actinomycetota bacterium]
MPQLLGFVQRISGLSAKFFGTAVGQAKKSKDQRDRDGYVEKLVPPALVGEHVLIVGVEVPSVGIVQGELEVTDVYASASRRDN